MLFHFLARAFGRQLKWHADNSHGRGAMPFAEGGSF